MNYLIDIARLSQSNIGGLVKIQVARKADVINIPEAVDGVIYGNIEFQQGKGFITWYVADQSMEMISEGVDSRDGIVKNNQLPFVIAKDRAELKSVLDKALDDEFIVLYRDGNGKSKLLGSLSAPARFAYTHQSGTNRSARNSYNCRFYHEGNENLAFYEGNIANAPVGGAPVIIQWNGVFQIAAQAGDVVNILSEFKIDDFLININNN